MENRMLPRAFGGFQLPQNFEQPVGAVIGDFRFLGFENLVMKLHTRGPLSG